MVYLLVGLVVSCIISVKIYRLYRQTFPWYTYFRIWAGTVILWPVIIFILYDCKDITVESLHQAPNNENDNNGGNLVDPYLMVARFLTGKLLSLE